MTSVDTAANTYTRQRNDGRVDLWHNNMPSDGLRYRHAAPNAAEVIGMNVANTGLTVAISVNPANSFYDISVDRP
ncbi:hypothetical protein D9M69_609100 [compost metagenome]